MKKIFSYFLLLFFVVLVVVFIFKSDIEKEESKVFFESTKVPEPMELTTSSLDGSEVNSAIFALNCEYQENSIWDEGKYLTINQAQNQVKVHREKVKSYFSSFNKEQVLTLGIDDLSYDIEISSYSPFVYVNFDSQINDSQMESIYNIAKSEVVNSVYIANKSSVNISPQLFSSKEIIGVEPYISNNPSINGAGIKIGILDAGIVDEDNNNFDGIDLTIRDELFFFETEDIHSTMVASVAGGNSGVARGASLYSVQISGNPIGEVEWLLDNGVNIINVSIGFGTYGTYNSDAAYFDYISRYNNVIFVGAAGNHGNDTGLIMTPNTAFNMITVGSTYGNVHVSDYSSYIENFNISKPNIVAPGEDLYIPYFSSTHSGTSFSSPLVAGSCALIMQFMPYVITHPYYLHTILASSAAPMDQYTNFDPSGLEDKVGAGLLDFNAARFTLGQTVGFTVTNNNLKGQYVSEKTIYLNAGKRLRIAFMTMLNSSNSTSYSLTDYDLYLYQGTYFKKFSISSWSNIEFIDFTIDTSGYYTIKVKQYSDKANSAYDYCSYTYYY